MAGLVSIIIPVYNGERYISQSINSALSQSYGNIEVIVVNDGSKDSSVEITKTIQAQDQRLKLVNQANGGVSAARKAGLEMAAGEWVCFLDADDTLPEYAISSYSQHFEEKPDIIVSGCGERLSKEEYLTGLLKLEIRPELWGKAFRAEFLKKQIPTLDRSMVMGEDLLQNLVIGLALEKMCCEPKLLYRINGNNPDSVTKVFRRSFDYENKYFSLLDDLFLNKCEEFAFYEHIKECVFWSKLNGLKQVVLDGNGIDCNSDLWRSIQSFYSERMDQLGASEKLLLHLSRHQILYRTVMRSHLFIKKLSSNFLAKR